MTLPTRRRLLQTGQGAAAGAMLPLPSFAQARSSAPPPDDLRIVEFVTRAELKSPENATQMWLPIPSNRGEYLKV